MMLAGSERSSKSRLLLHLHWQPNAMSQAHSCHRRALAITHPRLVSAAHRTLQTCTPASFQQVRACGLIKPLSMAATCIGDAQHPFHMHVLICKYRSDHCDGSQPQGIRARVCLSSRSRSCRTGWQVACALRVRRTAADHSESLGGESPSLACNAKPCRSAPGRSGELMSELSSGACPER